MNERDEVKCPVIPGVTFLDWNGHDGRARGAIVKEPVSSEVMQSIYRRLHPSARLDLAATRKRKVFAVINMEPSR